ncbi:MAG: radical SAM protein [Clostridia bacterium]|nr:radical SAM protein [Clostridia bacterium]
MILIKTNFAKRFCLRHLRKVQHTTLNPKGPGVVRIHLVPPKKPWEQNSVVILNGADRIPLTPSWAILICNFIGEVNEYDGKTIDENEWTGIITRTIKKTSKVYFKTSRKKMQKDLRTILSVFLDIAYGRDPKVDVGVISPAEYVDNMHAPFRMDIMVSPMKKDGHWNCNQKCVHCYAAGQCEAETGVLPTEDFFKVIDKCREAGIPQITFTGGEPTMNRDLPKLVDHAKWFMTRLNTNGIRMTEQLCEDLMAASLDAVQFTFYDAVAENHNQLVGGEHYDQTLEGITNAIKCGLSVSINTPLCTINRDYVNTLKFLHELGIIYVTCSGMIETGNARTEESQSIQLTGDELYEILREASKFCKENDMELQFTSPGWIDDDKLHELGLMVPACGACMENMAIAPNGDVVPCQSWLNGTTFGNILTDDWNDIWNDPECVKIRKQSAGHYTKCPLRD